MVAKIIRELKSQVLSLVEITVFRQESKLPPMRALEFIRDHVTFKFPYDFSYHMKTPFEAFLLKRRGTKFHQKIAMSLVTRVESQYKIFFIVILL